MIIFDLILEYSSDNYYILPVLSIAAYKLFYFPIYFFSFYYYYP